jgi:hypothetical protein
LCDTCPKAFHLVCLEPELEEAPEGDWYCPHCEKNGVAENKRAEKIEQEAKAAVDADGVVHAEFCTWCKDGGELICCEKCPQSYHIECLNPPLAKTPASAWWCPRCEAEKPPGVVKKIMTWRWKVFEQPKTAAKGKTAKKEGSDAEESEAKKPAAKKKKMSFFKIKLKKRKKGSDEESTDDEKEKNSEAEDDDNDSDEDAANQTEEEFVEKSDNESDEDDSDDGARGSKKRKASTKEPCKCLTTSYKKDPTSLFPEKKSPQKIKEFFCKFEGMSYWHCDWVSEFQMERYHKILFRYYTSRNDMTNPPTAEQLKENDGGCDRGGDDEDDELFDAALSDDYYKNGVRPEFLRVQRFLNYKKTNRGNEW